MESDCFESRDESDSPYGEVSLLAEVSRFCVASIGTNSSSGGSGRVFVCLYRKFFIVSGDRGSFGGHRAGREEQCFGTIHLSGSDSKGITEY